MISVQKESRQVDEEAEKKCEGHQEVQEDDMGKTVVRSCVVQIDA